MSVKPSYKDLEQRIKVLEKEVEETRQLQDKIHESREKFGALADSMPVAVMLYQDDRWISVNRAVETITGYSMKELLGMNFWDIVHPDHKALIQERGQKRQRGEETTDRYECKIITKYGTEKWVDLSGTSTMVEGRPAGLVSMVDISKRKHAEKALKKYSHDLNERVKEFDCLYAISELVRKEGISLEDIFQKSTAIVAKAYMYQEITVCRIVWGNHQYNTENFKKTPWSQECAIMIHGKQAGTIEVCYLEERPEEYEGPFLAEERKLLNNVAELLGKSTERKQAQEEREKLILELQEALSKIRVLSGILPTCSFCKRICNDKGEWEQIEAYIRDRSEAEFSHGICPECMEKEYPEYFEKK